MPSIEWDFCGPTATTLSPNWNEADAMNCYCEMAENPGTKTRIAMFGTPGKRLLATLVGEISVPSMFEVNGRVFAAASNLWELTNATPPVKRGSLGAVPTTPTMIAANETQLVVLNNGNLYVMTLATNAFVAVNMAQFNGPVAQIGFVDGYVIATLQNSHTFQQSDLEDATTWNGLNISTISYFPDNIVGMICDHREVWFWSAKKCVIYYNAGAGFPVFIPIQGAFLEVGCGAAFATVQADNSIYWLSQDERGALIAFRANGYAGERKSTHAEELAWQMYPGPKYGSDAVGYSYQENGHTFWVIYFPSANATWVYDVATSYWHKRGSYNTQSGIYSADRSMSHTFSNGTHMVGDWATGNIYEQSTQFYQDNGTPLRGYRRSQVLSAENARIFFDSIQFDMDTGQVPEFPLFDGNGQPRPPQIMLRWSNDAGRTWSNTYYLSLGFQGEYSKRVIKHMLGHGRKRVFDVSWNDPVPIRFAAAILKGEVEQD